MWKNFVEDNSKIILKCHQSIKVYSLLNHIIQRKAGYDASWDKQQLGGAKESGANIGPEVIWGS